MLIYRQKNRNTKSIWNMKRVEDDIERFRYSDMNLKKQVIWCSIRHPDRPKQKPELSYSPFPAIQYYIKGIQSGTNLHLQH